MPERQSLRNMHYAILKEDSQESIAYEKPKPLVGAINAKINPSSNEEKLYADDHVFDLAYALGDITLEAELATLPLKAQAALLGHKYENGVMTMTDIDEAPFLAIGFMSQHAPGKFRFVWLYKGKFKLIQDEYATATDSTAWRLPKLSGSFVKREHDGKWQVIADSSDEEFTGADEWFKSVYLPPVTVEETAD